MKAKWRYCTLDCACSDLAGNATASRSLHIFTFRSSWGEEPINYEEQPSWNAGQVDPDKLAISYWHPFSGTVEEMGAREMRSSSCCLVESTEIGWMKLIWKSNRGCGEKTYEVEEVALCLHMIIDNFLLMGNSCQPVHLIKKRKRDSWCRPKNERKSCKISFVSHTLNRSIRKSVMIT